MNGEKCVNCREVITDPGPVFEGETKRVWCGNGATYRTKTVRWCKPCWDDAEERNEEYRRRQDEELLAEIRRLKKERDAHEEDNRTTG